MFSVISKLLSRVPYFLVAFVPSAILLYGHSCLAATTWTSDTIEIREGGKDYEVIFSVASGELVEYSNGENCTQGHKTANGGRYYNHFHTTYALPKTGIDTDGNPRTVTNAKIDAYWDNYYAGYARTAGSDHTCNCWGYAFGSNVWVNDPSFIYADDYQGATATKVGNLEALSGHVRKITKICDNVEADDYVAASEEKNRYSGLYKGTWACPGGRSGYNMQEQK